MEYNEVLPLPDPCRDCREDDCYNCDYAGERWVLSEKQQLLLRRKMVEKAIARYRRLIAEIDKQLSQI